MTLEHRETRGLNIYSVLNRRCPRRRRPSFLGPFYTYPDIFESATFAYRIQEPQPDTATVHTHPANSTATSDIFKSALQSEKNKSATNPITCGWVNLDIFESDDVANSCPVIYRTINQYGGTTATTGQICRHYRALYGARSEHILLQRSLGYYSESGLHRIRVDRRIRFKYVTCGRGNF